MTEYGKVVKTAARLDELMVERSGVETVLTMVAAMVQMSVELKGELLEWLLVGA
jgi:hypothetical protein